VAKDFIQVCRDRGYFNQCTDEDGLRALMTAQAVPAYIGFDCTAKSLHVGSLMQIMILRWLQKCDHKPIVLMGGGTTKVGDPSGKDESRKMLTEDDINANLNSIKCVFEKFLTFGDGPTDAIMVNNADWLDKLNYIEFLRDYGRHFSVNRMLTMDSVKQRLERESHLSFLEFNYMVLQAYDFVELNQRLGCRLQIGGSDQWGNIVMGTELHKRTSEYRKTFEDGFVEGGILAENVIASYNQQLEYNDRQSLFGLTSPLITTSSGAKMGKTANGAVWLDADLLSPYDYWQFWRNTEDADVQRFLLMFTELEPAQIETLLAGNINDAKKVLATEATALLHGRAEAEQAAETARAIFEQGGVGGAMPEVLVNKSELDAGIPAFKLLVTANLATSGGEARRLIKGNGAKMNDAAITAEDQLISLRDMTADGYIKLSAGKKKHVLIKAA